MSNFLKLTLNNRLTAIISSLLLMLLSGCMQSHVSTNFKTPSTPFSDTTISASDNTIKMVNAVFYQSFIGGDWQYKGSTRQKDGINAYIQIAEQLDMSQEAQENYLQQAICPSIQHQQMWKALKSETLVVHIYTYKRKYSLYANCINPLITG
ncbi:hypothetical protein [Paraglaciecola sp.]|uniref:hypothetical protein n=1 Tax=Paraglaciecola sp. TaxID=1920173 RepID=UPI0030F40D5F